MLAGESDGFAIDSPAGFNKPPLRPGGKTFWNRSQPDSAAVPLIPKRAFMVRHPPGPYPLFRTPQGAATAHLVSTAQPANLRQSLGPFGIVSRIRR